MFGLSLFKWVVFVFQMPVEDSNHNSQASAVRLVIFPVLTFALGVKFLE